MKPLGLNVEQEVRADRYPFHLFNIDVYKRQVLDKGDKFVLEAELPGFQKEDIDIHVEGNTLTISAQHKAVSYTHLSLPRELLSIL